MNGGILHSVVQMGAPVALRRKSADWLVGVRLLSMVRINKEPFLLHCGRETEVSFSRKTLRPVFFLKILLYCVKFYVNITWQLAGGLVFPFCMGHSLGHC